MKPNMSRAARPKAASGSSADRLQDAPLHREDMLCIPFERGRQAHETKGLGCGRAIEHDDIELLLSPILIDVHHRAQLFHARGDGHLLGFHFAQAGSPRHGSDVAGNPAPMPLDLSLDVHFLNPEILVDGRRVSGGAVKQRAFEIERIAQAVSRIHAHHQSLAAEFREPHSGGCRDAGLADAALAAE